MQTYTNVKPRNGMLVVREDGTPFPQGSATKTKKTAYIVRLIKSGDLLEITKEPSAETVLPDTTGSQKKAKKHKKSGGEQ